MWAKKQLERIKNISEANLSIRMASMLVADDFPSYG